MYDEQQDARVLAAKSGDSGAMTDLILNMLLIPYLGATGAALGTLAAELVVFIIQFVALKNEIIGAFKTQYGYCFEMRLTFLQEKRAKSQKAKKDSEP